MSRGARRLNGHLAELTLVADFRDRPTTRPEPPDHPEPLTIERIQAIQQKIERIRVAFESGLLSGAEQECYTRAIESHVVATAERMDG